MSADDLLRELVEKEPQEDGRCVFCWEYFAFDGDDGHEPDCLVVRAAAHLGIDLDATREERENRVTPYQQAAFDKKVAAGVGELTPIKDWPPAPGDVIVDVFVGGEATARVTHLPTGINATSDPNPSQHRARQQAMDRLRDLLDK